MKPTLSLTALALVLASVPMIATADRAAGPRAMLQNLTFAEVDADGDGGVTLEEWRAFVTARAESLRSGAIDARVAELMAGDADGDGLLSPDELTARMASLRDERRAARAEMRGDGEGRRGWGGHEGRHEGRYEGRYEGRQGMRDEGRGWGRSGDQAAMEPGERIERSFDRIDRDGDGRLTEAEFDRAVTWMQDRMGRRG